MLQHPEEVRSVVPSPFSFPVSGVQHSHPVNLTPTSARVLLLPHVSARIARTGTGVIPRGGWTGARCPR
jgi:hypothetical protein